MAAPSGATGARRLVPAAGAMDSLTKIFEDVRAERAFQRERWPDCESLPDGTGGGGRATYEAIAKGACERAYREGRLAHAHVFEEEAAEVLAATEEDALDKELNQVIAVAVKWREDIARRRAARQAISADARRI
jgi:hypothetical protein